MDGAQTVKDLGGHLGVEKPSAGLPEHVKAGQAKAQKAVQARGALEASVSSDRPADTELLANYMAYISYEEARLPPPPLPFDLRGLNLPMLLQICWPIAWASSAARRQISYLLIIKCKHRSHREFVDTPIMLTLSRCSR